MKIVFMGTPDFALPSLQILNENKNINICTVYTKEPTEANRGKKITKSPIHIFSEKNNIIIKTPKNFNSNLEVEEFKNLKADLGVVVAYGLILPDSILNSTKYGFLNIHPSLLPKYRGAAPMQRSIINGDKISGISIVKMTKELDAGDILVQKEYPIENKTYKNLSREFANLGAEILNDYINKFCGNKDLINKAIKQEHFLATYAHKIKKEECLLDFNLPSKILIDKIRGLNGCLGAYMCIGNEKIKIFDAKVINEDLEIFKNFKYGEIINDKFWIKCKDAIIQPLILQRPSKNIMNINDFLLGWKF